MRRNPINSTRVVRDRFTAIADDSAAPIEPDNEPGLSEYKDILLDHKRMIAAVAAIALLIGFIYVTLAAPVYRANLLVQIEDSEPDSKSFLNETSGLFEVKTPASGEIQVLQSRMVLNAAADQADLQVSAQPRYLPFVGLWLASRAEKLSDPGIFGFGGLGGYVTGTERIVVGRLTVPASLEDPDASSSRPWVRGASAWGMSCSKRRSKACSGSRCALRCPTVPSTSN